MTVGATTAKASSANRAGGFPVSGSFSLSYTHSQKLIIDQRTDLVLGFDKNEVLVECLGGTIESPVWMYKADFDVSRASEITLSAYLRTAPTVNTKSEMGDDLFLGGLSFLPSFDAQVEPLFSLFAKPHPDIHEN